MFVGVIANISEDVDNVVKIADSVTPPVLIIRAHA